jgi:hypothetical protein
LHYPNVRRQVGSGLFFNPTNINGEKMDAVMTETKDSVTYSNVTISGVQVVPSGLNAGRVVFTINAGPGQFLINQPAAADATIATSLAANNIRDVLLSTYFYVKSGNGASVLNVTTTGVQVSGFGLITGCEIKNT